MPQDPTRRTFLESAGRALAAECLFDSASLGLAGTLEAARVLTCYRFNGTIVSAALSAEEQGLNGGQIVARYAQQHGWRITGVLNNDMIGNVRGIDGQTDNTTARVFSDGTPPTETEQERTRRRFGPCA